jgi:hypothetical protein
MENIRTSGNAFVKASITEDDSLSAEDVITRKDEKSYFNKLPEFTSVLRLYGTALSTVQPSEVN